MWFIFFDILWLIICNIKICFSFEWLFVMQLFISSEFYIKNIYLFLFFFFIILIKSNKQVDTIDLFNKWVILGLMNLNLFNKHIGLVLTYIVGYSWIDLPRIRYMNTNCYLYLKLLSKMYNYHPIYARCRVYMWTTCTWGLEISRHS